MVGGRLADGAVRDLYSETDTSEQRPDPQCADPEASVMLLDGHALLPSTLISIGLSGRNLKRAAVTPNPLFLRLKS